MTRIHWLAPTSPLLYYAPGVRMTARKLVLPLSALTLGLSLMAACGGDGGREPITGSLTDPASVPTATPFANPPEPVILGPDVLTPIIQNEGETNGNGDEVTPGECGDVYVVQSGDVPFTIAQQCDVDVNDLLDLNDIDDPTSLRVGQELKIPQ